MTFVIIVMMLPQMTPYPNGGVAVQAGVQMAILIHWFKIINPRLGFQHPLKSLDLSSMTA